VSAERIRVGINATALLSPLTGIGQYTKNLAEALITAGEVELALFYAFAWSNEVRTEPVYNITILKNFIKRVVPHPYRLRRALQQRKFAQGARDRKLHVYHEPNCLSHDFPGPTVITAHDLSWIRYPETHPADRVKVMNQLFPQSLARAAHVITDAAFIREEIITQFGVAPDRITSVPLAARAIFYPRDESDCRPVLALHDLTYRSFILCVGTLEPRKNLELMVRTYASTPEAFRKRRPLVLVGMKGWLTSSLESVMRSLVASGQVRPVGFVSDEELAALYASAEVLVYPSLYEGFGLPPLEAMSSGTPVIVSDRSTLPEVVGGAGILIDPQDEAALKESLLRLADDRDYWQDRRSMALEQASRFSWARCAQETQAIYRQVVAQA
jgi:glycosyltransferase involved in cell wall biosynthesis